MYHNNGYSGDGGDFPGNFNSQNNFQPYAGTSTRQPSVQQPQQQQSSMIHYEDSDSFMHMGNGFQPEVALFNQQAFTQNGFVPPQVSDSSKIDFPFL